MSLDPGDFAEVGNLPGHLFNGRYVKVDSDPTLREVDTPTGYVEKFQLKCKLVDQPFMEDWISLENLRKERHETVFMKLFGQPSYPEGWDEG